MPNKAAGFLTLFSHLIGRPSLGVRMLYVWMGGRIWPMNRAI